MFCNKCGNNIPDGTTFCPNCGNQIAGQPQQYYYPVPPVPQPYVPPVPQPYVPTQTKQPAKGLAITSMIMGILSLITILLVWFSSIFGSLGLIFGIVAKAKGNRSGMSTSGIVCSAITLVIIFCYAIFLFVMAMASSSGYYY